MQFEFCWRETINSSLSSESNQIYAPMQPRITELLQIWSLSLQKENWIYGSFKSYRAFLYFINSDIIGVIKSNRALFLHSLFSISNYLQAYVMISDPAYGIWEYEVGSCQRKSDDRIRWRILFHWIENKDTSSKGTINHLLPWK